MAPEVIESGKIDQKSNIWSLGVIAKQLFGRQNANDDIIEEESKGKEGGVGNEFARVIDGCLLKDPKKRYSSL